MTLDTSLYRNNVIASGIALLGMSLLAPPAHADGNHEVGTHGYFRIGAGFSGLAEDRACFQAPGADWKFRLGNECDTWIEGGIHDRYQPRGEDGPTFLAQWWVGTSIAEGRERLPRFQNTTQLFIEASNLPGLAETKLWIGRKYYQRHDIHINDFYWSEMLGDGFGLEDIDVSVGKLMYAYTRNHAAKPVKDAMGESVLDEDGNSIISESFQNNHDLRLYGLPLSLSGKGGLTVQAVFAHSAGNDLVDKVTGMNVDAVPTLGFAAALWHEENFDSLSNKISVQYGRGITRNKFRTASPDIATTVTSDAANDLLSANILRITEQVLFHPSDKVAVFAALVFQKESGGDYDDRDLTWYAAGIRPMYFFNESYRALLEYGFDRTEDNSSPDGISGNLHKLTIAGEVSTDFGFWNRPVVRAFATMAAWSDSFRGKVGSSGQGDPTDCTTKTSCYNVGVQAEYWW